eukprot:TRINITY_DN1382_c0_g3_i1.p1 TRINITY_DN1382_c0_g3~~TRINITY_DN1382_c0_g3_i1.p1  ORF type:complete len:419 (+),score=127.45 TRINITY_DN1382_c0_g3_i1:147-1259(+)
MASANFIVVGDIGCPGEDRAAVARAIRALSDRQAEQGAPPMFVLTTGDNLYDKTDTVLDSARAFNLLKQEMMDIVGLPWFFTLGNHDVGKDELQWHLTDWNIASTPPPTTAGHPWIYLMPSPCYSLNDTLRHAVAGGAPSPFDSLVDIVVINTNKYNLGAKAPAVGDGGTGARWWHYQKKWYSKRLTASKAAWKIVVGHHPIEFIPLNRLEHQVPGVRFIPTTFMKGGPKSRIKGTSYRDVIGECSDLYLCGHQHLMAHLVREKGEKPSKKGACEYAIVGSSSKTEGEAGSDDERESDSETSSDGTSFKSRLAAKLAPKVDEDKYADMWSTQQLGFLHVVVTPAALELRYYTLDEEHRCSLAYTRSVQKG